MVCLIQLYTHYLWEGEIATYQELRWGNCSEFVAITFMQPATGRAHARMARVFHLWAGFPLRPDLLPPPPPLSLGSPTTGVAGRARFRRRYPLEVILVRSGLLPEWHTSRPLS